MEEPQTQAAVRKRVAEIRLMALAEIATKDTGIQATPYFNELQGLAKRPFSTDWLEASVMLCVIDKARPSRAVNYLNKLRGKRAKQGEDDVFAAFEARLKDYLAPMVMTNHGFHDHSFADADHDAIWAQVGRHLSVLGDAGYEVFLNSGTLLGVIRDKRLIDHDDDIDLAIVLKATSAEDAAAEWRALPDVLRRLDLYEGHVEGMPGVYKLRPAGKTEIDIFPAWVSEGKAFVYPHTHGTLEVGQMLPLQTCALTGQKLPAAPEPMLVSNYGENWRNPDPLFKFPWPTANRNFAPFLERLV